MARPPISLKARALRYLSMREHSRLELTRKGHEIDLQGAFSSLVGGGQSVMRDYTAGVNYGASDPRKDGAAIPEPF